MYNCSTCGFSLHVSCAHKPRIEALKRDCHKHNLFYFVENENSFSCQKCCKKCKGGFYRCPECNINFHVDCIPLPRVMVLMKQTARYRLTFNLLDFVTEDDSDDVYDQHCEFCEKTTRNCEDHVYYCQEAEVFAHIECLLAEVSLHLHFPLRTCFYYFRCWNSDRKNRLLIRILFALCRVILLLHYRMNSCPWIPNVRKTIAIYITCKRLIARKLRKLMQAIAELNQTWWR